MKFRSLLGRRFCLLLWSQRAAWQVLVKQTMLFPAPPGPLLLPSVRRQPLSLPAPLCCVPRKEGGKHPAAPKAPKRCFFVPLS